MHPSIVADRSDRRAGNPASSSVGIGVLALPPMSASFSEADLRRLADLAQLELDDREVHVFADQLAAILAYAQELQQVDTTGIAPTTHAHGELGGLRADDPHASLSVVEALANAPEPALPQGFFKVPHVLGQS